MKYVHYWHFNKQWYCRVTNSSDSLRVPSTNERCEYSSWCEEYLVPDSLSLTHSQIKKKLHKMYPEATLVKEVAYHFGARRYCCAWNRYVIWKSGSRR